MSAIAGLWRFDGRPEVAADCARMLAAQQIYGPHDGRQWSDGALAMGRRLFRTLPEDRFDRQPLHSTDGRLVLAADVRLDNREELAAALDLDRGGAGRCDAAILLAALERWSDAALDRVVGDFAFALWDARAHRLVLARDFMGQRPLYCHRGKGFFAFASMAKGLHALAEVPYAADEQAMAEFVALLPQAGPGSFFKDIDRVEPGHCLVVTPGGVSSRRIWQPQRPDGAARKRDDAVEGLRHHLDQATRSRLRGANGAVATHLSAGWDSSAVTATAARLLAPEDGRITAFTAVPREDYPIAPWKNCIADEGPLAAATAAMYPNIEHVLIRAGGLSPLDELDHGFFLFERPMFNLCNWTWLRGINRAACAKGLTILLTGQMGNMSISYAGRELLPELLRNGRIGRLARETRALVANGQMRWSGALAATFGPTTPAWLWRWARRMFGHEPQDLLRFTALRADRLADGTLSGLASERAVDPADRPWKCGFDMRLWVMGRVDQGNTNKGTLAGWGIDQRDPTADRRLVEYCLSVPTDRYLVAGMTRALPRAALADRLPEVVLAERAKGRQSVDYHEGLTAARGDLATELARLAATPAASRLLDIARLRGLVDNWPTSWERDAITQAYRLALLRGVSAGHFLRKAAGTNL